MKKLKQAAELPVKVREPDGDLLLSLTLIFGDTRVQMLDYSPSQAFPHNLGLYKDQGRYLAPQQLRQDASERLMSRLRKYVIKCQREIMRVTRPSGFGIFHASSMRIFSDGSVQITETLYHPEYYSDRFKTHYFRWRRAIEPSDRRVLAAQRGPDV